MLKLPLVLVGPSGSGKTTLANYLLHKYPKDFTFSVSCTTRPIRNKESEGKSYYFLTKDDFQGKINRNEFVEWAEVHGNLYGTTKQEISSIQLSNKICLLDIDVQGAINLHKYKLQFHCISILPANETSIRNRLLNRNTETLESIAIRLENMQKELKIINENPEIFKYQIINNDLEDSKKELYDIIYRLYHI